MLKSKSKQLSISRVLTMTLGVILTVIAANNDQESLLIITLGITSIVFFTLIKKHSNTKRLLALNSALKEVNQNEISRAYLDLKSLDDGLEFYDAQHPYHEDLDLFGRHSLFQLINRTSTNDGKVLLAQWLSYSDNSAARERQKSVQELSDKIEFRQLFEAQGKIHVSQKEAKEGFFQWLNKNETVRFKGIYLFLLILLPLVTVATIVTTSLGITLVGLPFLMIVINLLVIGTVINRLLMMTKETENGFKSIGALKEHLSLIEKEEFKNGALLNLKEQTKTNGKKASESIGELKFLLDSLHNRGNLMYWLLNSVLLIDIYWLLKIIYWKSKNQLDIQRWYEVVAEIDSLSSIGGFAFSNPKFIYPNLINENFFIEAKMMGHPLINAEKRVSNDFSFKSKGGICLITGSNMSGKSTFLRTLGTNVVLAQLGGPVCCQTFQIGPMQVFTSMRTKDELEENVSSFYAELKRLKSLIESIDSTKPTLFMIDEVLKGTNSDDRHKGALALIRQLHKTNAFGLVSTHDLVLGGITNELDGVKNYSFNSEIKDAEINFDYKLTSGMCKSFNATQLMKNMGIEISD